MRNKKILAQWLAAFSLCVLSACGGGGSDSESSGTDSSQAPQAKVLTVKSYNPPAAGAPTKVISNDAGDRVEFWPATSLADGTPVPSQASYVPHGASKGVRIFYDTNGVPIRSVNEQTGEFMTFTVADDALYLQGYDASGSFQEGLKVFQDAATGKVMYAPILGRPFFSGQLSLSLTGGLAPISAALIPDVIVTGPASEIPANLQAFYEAQAASLSAASSGAMLSPKASATKGLGLAVVGLIGMVGGVWVAQPWLFLGGAVVFTVGVNELTGGLISDFIKANFANGGSPADVLTQQASLISSTGTFSAIAPALIQAAGAATDALTSFIDSGTLPVPNDLPVANSTPLTGSSVDTSGTTVGLTGSVSNTGTLTAQGSNGTNNLTINGTVSPQGQATGTFSGSSGSGTVIGNVSPLGVCQQITNSGGQGSFVQAHSLGKTTGVSVFTYNAFTVPDQFTVTTNGQTVFGTGGLVSGGGQAQIQLAGSAIVFVAVNAPQSGTAWTYELSCP